MRSWGIMLAVGLLLTVLIGVAALGTAVQADAPAARWAAGPPSGAADTTYTIVSNTLPYTTPILIDDSRYYDKTCFNIRTLTVYRAVRGGVPLENQPVIFFVHGGGWTDGYMSWYDFVSRAFTGEMGWVTVVIDYRLTANEVTLSEGCAALQPAHALTATKAAWYPDNIRDVAAALQWTVDHIAEYGGNPDQIIVFGHSAGGHLVSLLATHPAYAALRPAIKGVVSMSGAYSVKDMSSIFNEAINQTWRGGITDTAALDEGSPTTYVTAGASLPPFYLLHCQFDLPSLPEQAIVFDNKLDLLGFAVERDYLPGYPHVSEITATEFITAEPTVLIVGFVRKTLWPYKVYLPLAVRGR
ncbi:MAG TPA: alpha/beta hydrolase [Anaerolineae bacterium]|nr:alpha/beta hydrolase [Anaerolineae bacterium]